MKVPSDEREQLTWGEPPNDDVSFATLVDALADSQRHHLLAMLTDTGRTVSVDELATRLVKHAQTNRTSTAASSAVGNSEQRLRIRLQHVHLPKLADCNLIEYDAAAQTVTPTVSPTAEVLVTDLLASAK